MDFLLYRFPVSGVETYLFIPPLVMFLLSVFVSMGGVSGAFFLLPFQMSVLGYTSPGVSATNFVYNIVAIPLGVSRYISRKEMCWPLFWIFVLGSLPGVFAGYYIRVRFLPEPSHFKPFVGIVLGLLALKTIQGTWKKQDTKSIMAQQYGEVSAGSIGLMRCQARIGDHLYEIPTPLLSSVSLVVGVIGGAYGIGGGALLAPFSISVLNLPPRLVAGASLFSTWMVSVAGALIYAFHPEVSGVKASPDWLLGSLFGLGGMAGVYVGSVLQKNAPLGLIRLFLGLALILIAVRYLTNL